MRGADPFESNGSLASWKSIPRARGRPSENDALVVEEPARWVKEVERQINAERRAAET